MANYIVDSLDFGTGDYFALTTPYGTCSTAQATAAKVVDCDNFAGATLVAGAKITVKFTYGSVAGASLNVESTGAKTIRYRNANTTTSTWKANDTVTFVFDGTYWVIEGHVDTDTDTDAKTEYQSISTAGEYPVLFKPSTSTTTTAAKPGFDTTLTFNPSTNAMTLPGVLNVCSTTSPTSGTGITIKKCSDIDCALTFDCDGTGAANWRMAYLGSGVGDNNKLAFQSTASSNESVYNTALDLSMNNKTATFYGNVVVESDDMYLKNINFNVWDDEELTIGGDNNTYSCDIRATSDVHLVGNNTALELSGNGNNPNSKSKMRVFNENDDTATEFVFDTTNNFTSGAHAMTLCYEKYTFRASRLSKYGKRFKLYFRFRPKQYCNSITCWNVFS